MSISRNSPASGACGCAQIFALERQSDIAPQQSDLVAAVMGDAILFDCCEGLAPPQGRHRVSQLDLDARATLLGRQDTENLGLKDLLA